MCSVDDRLTIGYEPGTKIRGMIATALIPAKTVLIHTPGPLVLSAPTIPLTSSEDQCEFVEKIIGELKVGDQSKWHTHFAFDDSSGSHVPSQWDRSSRAMTELQGLPPSGETHRHIDWYQRACKDGKELTDLDWQAFKMFLTRSADIGLVPMYDLMNHHNGRINTVLKRTGDQGLKVIALDNISASEPIYNTYARSGWESSVDVFNTYGFVEDYPQLWRWNDEKLVRLSEENADHAYQRYGMSNSDSNEQPNDRLQFEPNSHHYEVLVVSPTLAALSPTKQLVQTLGNNQRTLEEWESMINNHHANLLQSHANAISESTSTILSELPTTIEYDKALIPDEKRRLEKVKRVGRVDVNKADAIQAIEYRLAFKKALRLATETAEKAKFLMDTEEL